jgi:hypothetical protein
MRNYRKSDYAINKYSPNIVYRFHDEIIEVSLEDYGPVKIYAQIYLQAPAE